MRWDIIKKSWKLAREHFADTKRLYVEMPSNFESCGQCNVLDLDRHTPIGIITYQTVNENGGPAIKLSLGENKAQVPVGRFASMDLKVETKTSSLDPRTDISVKDVMARYSNHDVLGEQVAYLIAGHEEGLRAVKLEESDIHDWVLDRGFPPQILESAKRTLGSLGIVIAKEKQRFQPKDRIRIVDPILRDYNEAGQVVEHRKTKDKERDKLISWYLVLVDGSSEPVWVQDQQLAKNMAGCTNG